MGKWNVSNDSGYEGVGLNNHFVNYSGVAGDYFIFSSDGELYTKEGSALDTLSYSFVSSGLTVTSVNIASNIYQVQNLTPYSVTLNWPGILTPGGRFARTIVLTR
jgi:hypothetical protein